MIGARFRCDRVSVDSDVALTRFARDSRCCSWRCSGAWGGCSNGPRRRRHRRDKTTRIGDRGHPPRPLLVHTTGRRRSWRRTTATTDEPTIATPEPAALDRHFPLLPVLGADHQPTHHVWASSVPQPPQYRPIQDRAACRLENSEQNDKRRRARALCEIEHKQPQVAGRTGQL